MTEIKCYWCDKPATWMRYTQFAGNHPFCDKHAELETDFGSDDVDWERLDDMLFNKKTENRITWKIEIDGITTEGKPIYHVYKARAPYGWDLVCEFHDYDQANRFVEKHIDFPVHFYKS